MSLDTARALGDVGMQRALEHAEADAPGWPERALAFLTAYAQREEYLAGFMVTMASEIDTGFPTPDNERAWGGIYRRAVREGVIEKTDKRMPHPRPHASEAIVYRSLIYGR